jgi:hypothetical protein
MPITVGHDASPILIGQAAQAGGYGQYLKWAAEMNQRAQIANAQLAAQAARYGGGQAAPATSQKVFQHGAWVDQGTPEPPTRAERDAIASYAQAQQMPDAPAPEAQPLAAPQPAAPAVDPNALENEMSGANLNPRQQQQMAALDEEQSRIAMDTSLDDAMRQDAYAQNAAKRRNLIQAFGQGQTPPSKQQKNQQSFEEQQVVDPVTGQTGTWDGKTFKPIRPPKGAPTFPPPAIDIGDAPQSLQDKFQNETLTDPDGNVLQRSVDKNGNAVWKQVHKASGPKDVASLSIHDTLALRKEAIAALSQPNPNFDKDHPNESPTLAPSEDEIQAFIDQTLQMHSRLKSRGRASTTQPSAQAPNAQPGMATAQSPDGLARGRAAMASAIARGVTDRAALAEIGRRAAAGVP